MNPPYAFAITIAQPLAQAVETLRAALAAEQMGIVSEVDMQATLKAKLGIDSVPQRILGVCAPKVAHALVTAEPDIAALRRQRAGGHPRPDARAAAGPARHPRRQRQPGPGH